LNLVQQRNCRICGEAVSTVDSSYCRQHDTVRNDLKVAFQSWKRAYGTITVENFLMRIIALPHTGDSARQVADFLLHHVEFW
jgi:hypothetical protein